MYRYDVAVSYETGMESKVQEVVDCLLEEGWEIFFAPYCQEEMLSRKLKGKLYQIYQNESLLKVLFVTDEYLRKEYTQLEMRSSVRGASGDERRLIIVNCTGDNLPGNLGKYVNINGFNFPDEIVGQISVRLNELREKKTPAFPKHPDAVPAGVTFNIENNKGVVANYSHIEHMSIGDGKDGNR